MSEPYRYPPLRNGYTRIVVVQPNHNYDAEIRCSLEPLFIDAVGVPAGRRSPTDQPTSKKRCVEKYGDDDGSDTYESLSYCWGHGARDSTISCDGRDLQLSENLHQALRRLRYRDRVRRLWIDAISINQADDEEKSEQVARMANIFRSSERGLIWLGDNPSTTDLLCLEFFKKAGSRIGDFDRTDPENIARHRSIVEEVAVEMFGTQFGSMDAGKRDSNIEPRKRMPLELESFFKTPWFGRRWVVQELFAPLTSTVVLGCHNIVWRTLSDVCRIYLGLEDYRIQDLYHSWPEVAASGPESRCMTRAKHLFMLDPGNRFGDILDYLEAFCAFECADDRDRVNSLLSLKDTGMGADYSNSVDDTYLQLAVNRVEAGQAKRLLECALRRVTFGGRTLPSWVPDWRVRTFPVQLTDPTFNYDRKNSSHSEDQTTWLTEDQQGLITRAHVIDIVYRIDFNTSNFRVSNIITFSGARRKFCRRFDLRRDNQMQRDVRERHLTQDIEREVQAGDLIVHYRGSESFIFRPTSSGPVGRSDDVGRVRLIGLCHEPHGLRCLVRPYHTVVAQVFERLIKSNLISPSFGCSTTTSGRKHSPGSAVCLRNGVPAPVDPTQPVDLMIV